ncbi:hypothetical protein BD310DRAFT_938045 [Dichomitus squalens]|uniref:Uncharacterized protein n=1 Tax=Dichomitus squalens TaxID=114155 RepID=A0A4Q9PIH3_9APHY|nr:hypothetical protein BD310DRAFT_938045 [Dichomitus squalens]
MLASASPKPSPSLSHARLHPFSKLGPLAGFLTFPCYPLFTSIAFADRASCESVTGLGRALEGEYYKIETHQG